MKKNIYLIFIAVLFALCVASCSKKATEPKIETLTEMIYVSGGTFHNGTSDVTLSSFYIYKYE